MFKPLATTAGDGLGDGEGIGEGTFNLGLGDGGAAAGFGLGEAAGAAAGGGVGGALVVWQAVASASRARGSTSPNRRHGRSSGMRQAGFRNECARRTRPRTYARVSQPTVSA